MQNRFNFIGTVAFPKEDAKRPFYHEFTKGNRKMRSMNFGVRPDKNNIGFVEMFGSEQDVIKARDTDNNPVEIDWADRFDDDVLSTISYGSKVVIDLGEGFEKQEFLSEFDAIGYLKENLKEDMPVMSFTGRFTKQFYEGKIYDKYQLQSVRVLKPDSNGRTKKPRLYVDIDLVYNKDCVDTSDWKEKRILYIDGYTPTYIDKETGTKYVPQRLILNASKVDPGNEEQMKKLNYRLSFIKNVGKKMVKLGWETALLNGAEEVEFDESMLTDTQKTAIGCGFKTLDDFRPRGQIFGNRITEFRMFCPKITVSDYANGFVDLDENFDTWTEENVYVPPKEETLDDVMESKEEPKNIADEIDENDLFV
ncbi:hypothetical protein ACTND3_08780 [Bacillota bacterium HCP28S3_F12]